MALEKDIAVHPNLAGGAESSARHTDFVVAGGCFGSVIIPGVDEPQYMDGLIQGGLAGLVLVILPYFAYLIYFGGIEGMNW